jgi:hypothetical protein
MSAVTGLFRSSVISDTGGNGGVITNNAVVDNAAENLFPHVTEADRTAGVTRYRKAYLKKLSGTLASAKFMIDRLSTAGDYLVITRAGDDDTQLTVDDIGWNTTVTWSLPTRQITLGAAQAPLAPGTLLLFTTAAGAFRGISTVATYIDTTHSTISTMIRGSDPATTDVVYTWYTGSGDLHTALTGGADTTVVADFEVTACILPGQYIALIDWDTLTDGLPTIEYCLVTVTSWAVAEGTLTISPACVSNHAVKTRGSVTGTGDENFDLDGLTLVIKVNGGTSQTVTFAADGMTAAQVAAAVNNAATGCTASASGTKVRIETDDYYAENSIQVLADSTADTVLGLDNSVHYGTTGTVVAGVLELGTVAASHSTPVKASPSGTFTDNIVDYDLGACRAAVTVTFSDAANFTVAAVIGGETVPLGAGVITAAFKAAHWGSYYFEIPTSCWGGTWVNGDTVVFTTYPSAKGIWFKEVVPASTPAYSGNRSTYTLDGETA